MTFSEEATAPNELTLASGDGWRVQKSRPGYGIRVGGVDFVSVTAADGADKVRQIVVPLDADLARATASKVARWNDVAAKDGLLAGLSAVRAMVL